MTTRPSQQQTLLIPRQSLRRKFIRTMLLVAGIMGASTLAIVIVTSVQVAAGHLVTVQASIEQGITSKGQVLTQNHALALRGMALDNAFLDMQRLVERAVKDDADLVYGMFVNSEHDTLAYSTRDAPANDSSPVRETWRALKLSEDELIVTSLRNSRVQRLGQDLLEVAVPVLGEAGEVLGTVRYGLSTRRMYDAMAQAKADSSRSLLRTVALVGSLVLLALLVGLWLSLVLAIRITRPISALTQAAQALASNNRAVRVQIESGDELELLGGAFNRMVEELDASYRSLEQMNHTLEQKVALRTAELANRNRDMRLVLDNVDEGFITLLPDGTTAVERSRTVSAWFGRSDQAMPFWTYMASVSPAFAEHFQMGWEQLMDGVLSVELCIDQLPKRMAANERTWSLRYLPFFQAEALAGVLVVIAEITERIAREHEEMAQAELMQAFKRMMHDRAGFSLFIREADALVEGVCSPGPDTDLLVLMRALHTLKGNAACQGLSVVASICHELEDELGRAGELSTPARTRLSSRWAELLEHVKGSGGMRDEQLIEIEPSEYGAFVADVCAGRLDREQLVNQLVTWQLEPVEKSFERLAEYTHELAQRLDKGKVNIVIEGNGVRIDRDAWSPFFSALTHVVRNAVDHGIESADQREGARKPELATLSLRAKVADSAVRFEVSDDGAGIDWELVREAARRRGLPQATHEDLLNVLCADGVSTRSEVTGTSGRGVGMAAVKHWVIEKKGRLDVSSTPGVGTTWTIEFPWAAHERSLSELRSVNTFAAHERHAAPPGA